MATQLEIEKVIESTDMVDLVSPYVKLSKQGKNYKGLCPFHDEKTPSFVVSQEKHLAHCFGCGKGGDPIHFLMDIKQISFNEALAELAKKNGIALNIQIANQKPNYSKYYEMLELATRFYKRNLSSTKSGKIALNYLYQRGLDDETIQQFDIGLAPTQKDALYQVLKEANYLELDMIDLGLVAADESSYHDIFTRRIMFPIKDEQGHTIGFSARIFDDPDPNQPKYINTKETFLYHKGAILYHLDAAKNEILRKKRVILHEGQMDVIASTRSGLKESICTMGTALTVEQAKVLKKYADHAIICYDGDKAGIAASKKAISTFQKAGMQTHLVLLPNGMDPDEFVLKNGSDEYLDYFESHILDEFSYLFEIVFLNRNLEDDSIVEQVKQEAFSAIQAMPSQTLKEKYFKELSNRLKASIEAITSDYNTYCSTNVTYDFVEDTYQDDIFGEQNSIISTPSKIKPQRIYELRLFLYARQSRENALEIDRRLGEDICAFTPKYRSLWMILIDEYYAQYENFDDATFMPMLSMEQKTDYLDIIDQMRGHIGEYEDADLNCIIKKMHEVSAVEKNKIISEQIKSSSDLDFQTKKIAEKFNNKKKMMSTRRK